jgi:hypothetical protein
MSADPGAGRLVELGDSAWIAGLAGGGALNRQGILVGYGATAALAMVAVTLMGCNDSTGSAPITKPESELEFVPVRTTAPPLETTDTSFWAVKGEERELVLRFQGQGGPGTGSKFLQFSVPDNSLLARPDGSSFQTGDSVEISVSVDPGVYIVNFEPSGLRFNPSDPAELELDYGETEDDFLIREGEFDAWRQELSNQPWELIGSLQMEELDEIEIDVLGFTRYALAIGR